MDPIDPGDPDTLWQLAALVIAGIVFTVASATGPRAPQPRPPGPKPDPGPPPPPAPPRR